MKCVRQQRREYPSLSSSCFCLTFFSESLLKGPEVFLRNIVNPLKTLPQVKQRTGKSMILSYVEKREGT